MKFRLKDKLLRFIPFQGKDFIGLDIGKSLIKALVVKNSRIDKFFIEKNNQNPIPLFVNWIKKKKLAHLEIRLSIKEESALLRYISFPKVDKKRIKEVFEYEVTRFVPFSREEVYFDVAILDENYSEKEFLLLLAVAKKDFIDSIIKQFQENDLNLTAIIPNSINLINLYLASSSKEENVALLDIGLSSTLLNLVKKKLPCLSREIKIALFDFLKKLSKREKLDFAQLEEDIFLKKKEFSQIKEVVEDFGWELSQEIKSSFDYFEINWGQNINRIFLSGGGAKLKGLEKTLANSLGIPVEIWNPLNNFKIKYPQEFFEQGEILATVLGMGV